MKIDLNNIPKISAVESGVGNPIPKKTIVEMLDKLLPNSNELQGVENAISQSNKLSPSELLGYQLKASNYHIRVELVSKVAESVLGTVRKFQGS